MALPEQIRKQSEDIQKLYTDMEANVGDGTASTDPVVIPPVVPPVPTVPAAIVPPAAATEPLPAGEPADEYKQKYLSLQGMYNADVPKLNATIKEQADRMAQMETLMATLQTVPTPAAAAPAVSQITEAEKAEWGDSIEMMRKVTKEVVAPIYADIAALRTALNNMATSVNTSILPQVRHVAQQQVLSAEDRFWSDLQREVPNWQDTNNSPDFKSWLLSVDDLTGHTRQSFLEQAQKSLEVNRVIAFFRSYAAMTGKQIPPAAPITAQPNGSASELEKQLAPGRSRGSAPIVNQNAKTYSSADITKFYDDVRKGVYRGREPERNQIEADIFAARKENRIVANA